MKHSTYKTVIARAALAASVAIFAASPSTAQEAFEFKIAHPFPPTHYLAVNGIDVWLEKIKERLGDRVSFTLYPAQQLGKSADTLELAETGVAEIVLTATSYHPARLPLSGVAELPGMYDDICAGSQAALVLSQEGALLDEHDFAPNNVRSMFNVSLPIYKVVTSTKPVRTLEDVANLKLRTTGGAMDLTARALGAVAVRMASAELFQAAERGTVDGALYLYTGMPPYDLQTVFKHATEGVSLGSTHVTFLINRDTLDALPADIKQAFLEAGAETSASLCKWMDGNDGIIRDTMVKEDGLQVIQLDEEQVRLWEEKVEAVAADWVKTIGEQGKPAQEVIDAYRAEVEKAGG